MKCFRSLLLAARAHCCSRLAAAAQTPPTATPAARPAGSADPDARVDALQPDFNLAALPTTLRMPLHKLAFRVTHRFTRPLGQGDFGDLVSDFFGFDSGAQIGLELRYGLARGTQIGVHRTSDRTIQIFGQHNFWNERDGKPLGLDAIATLEGANNLQRALPERARRSSSRATSGAARRCTPSRCSCSTRNPAADAGFDNNTLMVGLGGTASRPAVDLPRRGNHAAARRLRAGREPGELRPRRARRRAPVSVELLERLRHDARPDCRRRRQQRQLVHRLQHLAEVLLSARSAASLEDNR